jgi:hypothetical protein
MVVSLWIGVSFPLLGPGDSVVPEIPGVVTGRVTGGENEHESGGERSAEVLLPAQRGGVYAEVLRVDTPDAASRWGLVERFSET